MAHTGELAGPVMRRATGFDADEAGRKPGEKRHHVGTAQPFSQYHFFMVINAVDLKNVFARSRPIRLIFMTDTSTWELGTPQSGTLMP